MWRLTCEARGWGTKGSGLGLLGCATLDDSTLADDEEHFDGRKGGGGDGEGAGAEEANDRGESRERSFRRSAGEVSFECYVQPPEGGPPGDGGPRDGTTVTVHVPWGDMFVRPPASSQMDGQGNQQAEKYLTWDSGTRW
jgi:hypothetical protein